MEESGGHRWQRVPPTERKGRVHTSTVTVVAYEPTENAFKLNENDIQIFVTKDTGPGGQHRNTLYNFYCNVNNSLVSLYN